MLTVKDMGYYVLCFSILWLIQSSTQYSIGGELHPDAMVSGGGWSSNNDDVAEREWQQVPRGCGGKPADIYFVLDTAGGADPERQVLQLSKQKTHVQALASLIPEQSPLVRVGLVTFGSAPILSRPLGRVSSLPAFREDVWEIPRVGGKRNTAQALKYLRHTAFSPSVARKDSTHVVILLTRGYSTDAKQTALEASLLREQGVMIYVISISPSASASGHVDKGELLEMGSAPSKEFVFGLADDDGGGWDIVGSLMEVLRVHECVYQVLPPVSVKEPVCVSRRPTELAFAVEHLGLGSPRTKKIITFIQALLAEVDPDSPMRAAILTSKDPVAQYSAFVRPANTIPLLEKKLGGLVFPDLAQLLRRAGKMMSSRESNSQSSALSDNKNKKHPLREHDNNANNNNINNNNNNNRRWKRTPFQKTDKLFSKKFLSSFDSEEDEEKEEGRSEDVQKVLVVFVDDSVHLSKKAVRAARINRRHKVDTYVVYVSQGGIEQEGEEEEEGKKRRKRSGKEMEVVRLASGSDHVVRISGYHQLRYRDTVVDTLRTVCRGL